MVIDMLAEEEKILYVIIPVYNNELFIEKAVFSVLNQPYPYVKVLLIDDGSTDNSGKICDSLSSNDKRIVVIHQNNQGVSAARNKGIEYVLKNGNADDYIGFCDSDDFWVDNTINSLSDYSDVDIIGFGTYKCNYKANRFYIHNTYSRELLRYDSGTIDWCFGGHFAAHLFKVELIEKYHIKFYNNVKYNEDVIFMRQCILCSNSFYKSNKFLYVYRNNKSSVTSNINVNLDNAFDVATAWLGAIDFSNGRFPEWKNACKDYAGGRILEAIRLLAENGYKFGEIRDALIDSGMDTYLNNFNQDSLSEWQKNDYKLYINHFENFVKYYNKKGKIKRLLIFLKKNQLIKNIYDMTKYTIKEI